MNEWLCWGWEREKLYVGDQITCPRPQPTTPSTHNAAHFPESVFVIRFTVGNGLKRNACQREDEASAFTDCKILHTMADITHTEFVENRNPKRKKEDSY
eukprot:scaffold3592_cov139-Skeletonema_marinoi.AAC.12